MKGCIMKLTNSVQENCTLQDFRLSLEGEGLSSGTVDLYVRLVRGMLRECEALVDARPHDEAPSAAACAAPGGGVSGAPVVPDGLAPRAPAAASLALDAPAAAPAPATPAPAALAAWRDSLICRCKPATVNLRIHAVNRYLRFLGRADAQLASVRAPHLSFTDNVVGEEDYLLLKARLRADGRLRDYFAVWTMAATGLRVSELLGLTRANLDAGFADVVGKGGKVRRVWFPAHLHADLLEWATTEGLEGSLFLNCCGEPITARGLAQQIKAHARAYGLNDAKVHPHALRHYFAKRCLESRIIDLPTLADLLGHSSIETTRIYLRRSSSEQLSLVNQAVTW